MALEDILLAVSGEGDGIAAQPAGIFAQPHRAALLVDMLLVGHQVDHRVRRVGVNLAGVRAGQTEHVAGVFHHGHLHAQTNAQKRHAMLAGILHGGNLALQPALAEAARHKHAAAARQLLRRVLRRHALGRHPFHAHLRMMGDAAVGQRLDDREIRIRQLDIFADNRNADVPFRGQQPLDHAAPFGQVGLRRGDTQQAADTLVHALLVNHQRHFVNAARVEIFEHAVRRNVAEQADLRAHIARQRLFAAADDDIRLNPQSGQLLDGVLGRLGLQFARRGDIRHERHMDIQHVFAADLVFQLARRLEERQGFDVADRAADLGDDHVRRVLPEGDRQHAALDLVGDVRNDLNRRAQIFALALAGDDGIIHAAAGDVGRLRQVFVDEALVMPQIEIRLRAVVGDKDLAVLIRVHRAGIDVDIGIKLLHGNPEPAALEQPPQRSRRDALAQRGDDAARHKNKLGVHPIPSFRPRERDHQKTTDLL